MAREAGQGRQRLCCAAIGQQHAGFLYALPDIVQSMGGLVAADSLIGMVTSRPDPKAPLWPKIIACIAFDTPVWLFRPPFVLSLTSTFVSTSDFTLLSSKIKLQRLSVSSRQHGRPQPPLTPSSAKPLRPQRHLQASLWQPLRRHRRHPPTPVHLGQSGPSR